MVKMDADMDSPDRILSTPSSAVQGSPFFTYLSNLSPIKPIKSAHVAQTFSELHFPPPPAVFTSPRVSSQKELNFLRRASPKGIGEEEKKILNTSCEKVKDFAVPLSDCDVPTFVSPVAGQVTNHDILAADQIKCDDKSMPTFPGCSPSKIVEQYLADPAEGGHYTVDSSKLYSKTPSPGLVEALFTGSDKLEDAITDQCEKMKDMEVISQSKSSEEFLCANERYAEAEISQGNEEGLSSDLEQSLKISTVRDIGNTDQNSNGEMPNVWSHVDADHTNALNFANDCEASGAGTSHDENLVDQTASAFAFLLSKGSTHSIEAWQKASSADPSNVSIQKDLKDLGKHSNQVGVHGNFDGTAQPAYNSLQDTNSVGNLNVKTDTDPNRPMEHTSYACKDANQPQRGMRRRCLDFEASEARRRNLVNETWKSTSMLPKTGSLVTTDDDSEKNTSSVSCERTATSDGKQLVLFTRDMGADTGRSSQSLSIGQLSSCSHKHSEPNSDKVDSSVRINGNSSISVGMPSGIGLHLNSLASTMPLNCGVGMLTTAKGSASMQGMQTSSVVKEASGDGRGCCLLPVSSSGNKSLASNTSMAPGMVVSVVEKTRIDQQEVQSSGNMQIGLTKSTTCFRSLTVGIKPLQCRQPFKTEEINPSPLEKKRPVLQDVSRQTGFGIGEEYNQNSPKKKRKSATIGDKEGCKRCNCKKSKCLKLYCECFAAGVYCVESCTCQECFNKPEYTDMVVGTRQQIESRNPLAFAPKIVHGADSPPTNGQKESTETPASARHKRGCNCKKSMCLKKYCECYQAGVGCSDGCRCEGCKNTFGKKEGGSDDTEDKEAQDEVWEKSTAEEKLELVNGNDILETEQRHSKDLSPLTPSFQYVGQDRSTVKLKPFGKRRFNTEDLESPIPSLSQSSAKPPRSPAKILRSTKGSDTVIFNHQVGSKTSASPIFTPKMEKSGQFSSRWDGLADICTLTPALQPPLRPATASVSNVDGTEVSPFGGQHNEISSLNSHPFASRHSCHGGSPSVFCHTAAQSPVCTSDSFHWQTPVNAQTTPMTRPLYTSVCNAGKKLVDGPGIDMHSQDLCGSVEDDTPDILKNDCSPMRGIKASSPNQKRVSPPHNYSLKEMSKRGPISSPRLKNGRKFILQSVPSFPPLNTSEEVQDKD